MPAREAIFLTLFLISVPICFFRPFFGVLLWYVVAFLNPQSYVWGGQSGFQWAVLVAIPTMAGTLINSASWNHLKSSIVFVMLALWVWFTFTTVASTQTPLFMHHAVDTWDRWRFVSKMLLMTGVTIAVVNTFERLRMLLLVVAGCFGFYAAKAFPFVIFTAGAFRVYGPENSMIADNNDFGLAMNMTMPLFFFLALTEKKVWLKRLFGLLSIITIPVIFATYSRGALIGLVAVLGLMFFKLKNRLILVPVIALGLVVALLFAPASWKERMDLTRPEAVDSSARSRFNAWTFCWNLATDYPIAGGGFATFTHELFVHYAPHPEDVHGPHSIYFGVLAEHGFIGLALYLTLLLAVFRSLRRTARMARFYEDTRAAQYANMFQFSLVGFLTSGMFLGRAYFDYFFLIVACTVMLRFVCEREWSEESSAELMGEAQEQMA